MRVEQFKQLAELEESHWWLTGRRRIVASVVDLLGHATRRQRLVEIGCGTGANLSAFADRFDCVGVDTSPEAVRLAARRFPGLRFVCGTAPQETASLVGDADVVLLLDVLEHVADDFGFLASILRSMPVGAHLVVAVPADMELWSNHDVNLEHFRRYDRRRLERVWEGLPVTCRLCTPFNTRLLPAIRWIRHRNRRRGTTFGNAGTDLREMPGPMNWILHRIFAGESKRVVDCFRTGNGAPGKKGASLLAVLRREAGDICIRRPVGEVPADPYNPSVGAYWHDLAVARGSEDRFRSGVTLVVPCFNEARRFAPAAFKEHAVNHPGCRFLFIDDGSTDDTRGILDELCQSEPATFQFLALGTNRGKSEAVRQGFLAALSGDSRYIGYWDADLATPLEAVNDFLKILDDNPQVDLVCGSRMKLLGHAIHRNTLRHSLGRCFATAVEFALGIGMYDTQCGAKLFRVTRRTAELFREPFISRWILDVELLARYINSHGFGGRTEAKRRIAEYPLKQWCDVPGSKMTLANALGSLFSLVRIRRQMRARTALRPVPEIAPKLAPPIPESWNCCPSAPEGALETDAEQGNANRQHVHHSSVQ